jgi:orotate phosphoribosyltransferase
MNYEDQLLDIFRKKEAYLEGHFLLSSGLHSQNYMQCAKILQFPEIAADLGRRIHQELRDTAPSVDLVLSPALGGVIIGHEVAHSFNVPFIFCEREEKEFKLRRGFEIKPGQNVVVVEDVVTTGLSTKETIAVAEKEGAKIVGVGSIVDRSAKPIGFPAIYVSLLKLPLDQFRAEECPLCAKNVPLVKPGSRRLAP